LYYYSVDQQSEQRTGRLVLEERLNDVAIDPESSGSNVYNNPYASLSIQQQRTRLPIFKVCIVVSLMIVYLCILESKSYHLSIGTISNAGDCGRNRMRQEYSSATGEFANDQLEVVRYSIY
jgi:hypothetical protein